eukprot:7782073-Prorocentrum_lima.AAC.1
MQTAFFQELAELPNLLGCVLVLLLFQRLYPSLFPILVFRAEPLKTRSLQKKRKQHMQKHVVVSG